MTARYNCGMIHTSDGLFLEKLYKHRFYSVTTVCLLQRSFRHPGCYVLQGQAEDH